MYCTVIWIVVSYYCILLLYNVLYSTVRVPVAVAVATCAVYVYTAYCGSASASATVRLRVLMLVESISPKTRRYFIKKGFALLAGC